MIKKVELILNTLNKNSFYILLFGLLTIIAFYPFMKVGFATYDDAQQFIIGQSGIKAQTLKAIDLAINQGRIMISFFLSNIPYYIDNILYIKILSIGSILVNLFIFLYLMNLFINNLNFMLLFLVFFLTFLQNSFDHNLIVSYPLLFQIGFFFLNISIWTLYKFLGGNRIKFLYLSSIFFLLSAFIYEMFLAYILIILVILYYKAGFKFSIANVIKVYFPYFISLLLYGGIYFLFRIVYPPQYDGVTLDSHFSLICYLKVLLQFSISSFPGYIYFHYKYYFALYSDYLYGHKYNLFYLIKNANIEWILKSIITFALSFSILFKQNKAFNQKKSFFIFILSIMLIFLPNTIISLSTKYQKWVETGTLQYTVTYFSYFGVILLCTILIFTSLNCFKNYRAIAVLILSCLVALFSLITDYSNYYVSKIQSLHQVKWSVLNEFINTDEFRKLDDHTLIYAPSLFEKNGFPQAGDYWTSYLKVKTGKNINIISNLSELNQDNKNIYYLNYHQEMKNNYAYLTFSKVSYMQNDTIYSDHISLLNYSNYKNFSITGSIKDETGSTTSKELFINNQSIGNIKYNSFMETINTESSRPIDLIKIDSPNIIVDSIGVSYYTDIANDNYYSTVKTIFKPTFSELEKNGNSSWRWSGRQSEIILENKSDSVKNVTVQMVLNTGYKDYSNFLIYGENFTDSFKLNNEGYNYTKNLVLQPNSKLSIILKSDAQQVVAPKDSRELVFVLKDFKLLNQP